MPSHSKLKKDVPNCEKLREAVRERRDVDIRMGGTRLVEDQSSYDE